MEKRVGVYKIQSKIKPTRIYVGSSVDLNRRRTLHKSDLRRHKHRNNKMQNHVNKYGIDDLEFSIIEEFSFISKKHLLAREQYYLDLLNPWFNISPRADSQLGVKRSAESRKRYSNAVKGRKASLETRKKQSDAKKGLTPWNRGVPHSQETKKKISKTKKKTGQLLKFIGILKKWVFQYDLNGNFINKFATALKAGQVTGMDRKAIGRRCRLGLSKSLHGFRFMFVLVDAPERYYRM